MNYPTLPTTVQARVMETVDDCGYRLSFLLRVQLQAWCLMKFVSCHVFSSVYQREWYCTA